MIYDVAIIGGGPGGLTAGIYCPRYGLQTIVFEKMAAGGQMNLTETIENYPGFENPINGFELSMSMEKQAKASGAEIKYKDVTKIDLSGKVKKIWCDDEEFQAKSVIISTGASSRKLGIPGEKEFSGKGVSYCGTCDAPLFKNKIVTVIGGGDTALEEAEIIAKHASKVYIVHRRDEFRGQKILQEKVFQNDKIEVIWDSVPEEIKGTNLVEEIILRNKKTHEKTILKTDGVFVFIGYIPNTEIFKNQINLSKQKFILVDNEMKSSQNGVWACGDVVEKNLKQITLAVGEGTKAAFNAFKFLSNM